MISIQTADFDLGQEYAALRTTHGAGAVVCFVGLVRDFAPGQSLWLEHYPRMTQRCLEDLANQARDLWSLLGVRIIHRIGTLAPGDQIVLVGVSSMHRHEAFAACSWLMDMLKTQAPFWKKEGEHWVEAKAADQQAAQRWQAALATKDAP